MSLTARIFILVAVLWGAVATTAHADTFTYGFFGGSGAAFSVTSPTLLSTYTIFTDGVSCSIYGFEDCASITLDPVVGFAFADIFVHDQVGFSIFVPIPPSDFLAPGTYAIGGPSVIFSIVDNATTVTPEPSSLLLLATGVAGLATTLRRRARAA